MVIDSSAVINIAYDGDLKVKKKEEGQEIKPVDGSGSGSEPELNINKDQITEKTPEARKLDTGDIYKQNGEIKDEENSGKNQEMKAKTIDIVI